MALSKRVLEEGGGEGERGLVLKTTVAQSLCSLTLECVARFSKIVPLLSLQIQNGEQQIVPQIHYSVKGNANGLITQVKADVLVYCIV